MTIEKPASHIVARDKAGQRYYVSYLEIVESAHIKTMLGWYKRAYKTKASGCVFRIENEERHPDVLTLPSFFDTFGHEIKDDAPSSEKPSKAARARKAINATFGVLNYMVKELFVGIKWIAIIAFYAVCLPLIILGGIDKITSIMAPRD